MRSLTFGDGNTPMASGVAEAGRRGAGTELGGGLRKQGAQRIYGVAILPKINIPECRLELERVRAARSQIFLASGDFEPC
jgi:hypothetical protein